METPKHEQPKITIGEQEFQKVGNMNSEPTDLKYTPKNYDLYQDTESGALVGKLPEYHPSYQLHEESNESMEQKIKYLNIDLMSLNREEILSILKPGVKIYGKYTAQKYGSKDGIHNLSYEGKLEIVIANDNRKYIKIKDGELINYADVVADKDTTVLKNRILIDSHFYDPSDHIKPIEEKSKYDTHLEFSFYQLPEGLDELTEKKTNRKWYSL